MADVDTASATPLFPDLPTPLKEGRGRIRPRARLLRTIGAELISSEVVAVIELVRNSYDADATRVDLVFDRPENPDLAVLEIRDNGHGMDRDILLGPWLEPATDHKSTTGKGTHAGERSPGGRRRLGSKGVGRFAAQRLGRHLELRTRADDTTTELIARFDWRALEADTYLDQVRIPWREAKPEHLAGSGTHLRITRLRDAWTPDRFEKLKLGLARLVSPGMYESFKIRIVINGAGEDIRPALDAQKAMYSLEGTVCEGGEAKLRYRDINGDDETWDRTVVWPAEVARSCGPMSFRINAWDLDREPLKLFLNQSGSPLGLRDFRRVIRSHSGISLYRDGFRILPYGEPDNDWLRLDRRRVNNPTMRLSNNQILGTIQLSADQNPGLRDQTNREGLVTNDAYRHLREVVLELLGLLETRRFSARRAMDIDWRPSSSLPRLQPDGQHDHISSLLDSLGDGSAPNESIEELRSCIRGYRDATADAVQHYASLASVGQMSGLVFRQIRHPIRQLRSDLSLVLEDLCAGLQEPEDAEDVADTVSRALTRLDDLEHRMGKVDPLAVGRRGRRLSQLQLNEVLMDVTEAWAEEFDRRGVCIDFHGDVDAVVRSNREVVQQVLSNLLDNALHHAPLGSADTPTVVIRVHPDGFQVSDSGPGVAEADRASVFEPHFTNREDAFGLGLPLCRDLLQTIGGRIVLEEASTARFVVKLE